jgi:hypothetical protein
MGLLFTGFNMNTYLPQEDTGTVIDTGSFEYQINYLMAQHDIIVEDYFTFADRFPSTKYAR